MATDERHTPASVIAEYQERGIPGAFQIPGTPTGRVLIAPHHHQLTLLVQALSDASAPDVRGLANISYELEEMEGFMWHRLDVRYSANLVEAYRVMCSVLDRLQVEGEGFAVAVGSVLSGLDDILAGRGELSHEKQVGLVGELAALLSIAGTEGWNTAMKSWRGADGEEHDFGLATADLEVKTTTAEHRLHWISGPTQLLPTAGRDLVVLSVQVTTAGGGPGHTLPELVHLVRADWPGVASDLARLLSGVGYSDTHADLYTTRWTLRSPAAFFRVDDEFPAITPASLALAIQQPSRVVDLRYRVSLDGLEAVPPLFPVTYPGLATE